MGNRPIGAGRLGLPRVAEERNWSKLPCRRLLREGQGPVKKVKDACSPYRPSAPAIYITRSQLSLSACLLVFTRQVKTRASWRPPKESAMTIEAWLGRRNRDDRRIVTTRAVRARSAPIKCAQIAGCGHRMHVRFNKARCESRERPLENEHRYLVSRKCDLCDS